MTSSWDVFHSVRLEVERGVDVEVVRSRLAAGALNGDDLIRPAGTTRWSRIAQVAAFQATEPAAAPPPPAPEILPPVALESAPIRLVPLPDVAAPPAPDLEFPPEPDEFVFEDDDEPAPEATAEFVPPPVAPPPPSPARAESPPPPPPAKPDPEPPVLLDDDEAEPPVLLDDDEAEGPDLPELDDPLATELEPSHESEDDPASDFTLSRNSTETVEELDLAAMVDVAFQLVLFFLVTASTVVFKTLEIPRPNEDKPPEAAAQSRAKSIDELEKDFILVEVDAEGAVKIDHLPVPADRASLIEKLRTARETTGRKEMLLSADFATRHKNAVLAFDVASEIDLQIAIAQPVAAKN